MTDFFYQVSAECKSGGVQKLGKAVFCTQCGMQIRRSAKIKRSGFLHTMRNANPEECKNWAKRFFAHARQRKTDGTVAIYENIPFQFRHRLEAYAALVGYSFLEITLIPSVRDNGSDLPVTQSRPVFPHG